MATVVYELQLTVDNGSNWDTIATVTLEGTGLVADEVCLSEAVEIQPGNQEQFLRVIAASSEGGATDSVMTATYVDTGPTGCS